MAEVKRRRKPAVAGIAPSEPERDILDQYLYEVSTYPLLKGTEEIEVARRIRAGDPDALQELVQRNLRFVADEMPDTEEEAMNRFLNDEIETALSTLPPRDAKVLRLYFGLEGGREHTLEEIGSLLGVTRERVRQLRDRALKRLREGDVGRALGSFAA